MASFRLSGRASSLLHSALHAQRVMVEAREIHAPVLPLWPGPTDAGARSVGGSIRARETRRLFQAAAATLAGWESDIGGCRLLFRSGPGEALAGCRPRRLLMSGWQGWKAEQLPLFRTTALRCKAWWADLTLVAAHAFHLLQCASGMSCMRPARRPSLWTGATPGGSPWASACGARG